MANKYTEVGNYQVLSPSSGGGIDSSGFHVDSINPSSLLAGSSSLVREIMSFNRMKLEDQKANIKDGLEVLQQITGYSNALAKAVGDDPRAREHFNAQMKPYTDAIKGVDLNNPASLSKLSNYAANLAVDMSTEGSYFNTLSKNARQLAKFEELQSNPEFMRLQEKMPYLLENQGEFQNFKGSYTYDEEGKVKVNVLGDVKISPYRTSEDIDKDVLENLSKFASVEQRTSVDPVKGLKSKVEYTKTTMAQYDDDAVDEYIKTVLPQYESEISRRAIYEKSQSKDPSFDIEKRRKELENEYVGRLKSQAKDRIVKQESQLVESDYNSDRKYGLDIAKFTADQQYKAARLADSREKTAIARSKAEKETSEFSILPRSTGQQVIYNESAFKDNDESLHYALNPYREVKNAKGETITQGSIRNENLQQIGRKAQSFAAEQVNYNQYKTKYNKKPVLNEFQTKDALSKAVYNSTYVANQKIDYEYFLNWVKKANPKATPAQASDEARNLLGYYRDNILPTVIQQLTAKGGILDEFNTSKQVPEAQISFKKNSDAKSLVAKSLGSDAGLFANNATYNPTTGKFVVYKEEVDDNDKKTGKLVPYEVKDPAAKRAILNDMLEDPGFKKYAQQDPDFEANIVNAALLSKGLTPSANVRLSNKQWSTVLNSDLTSLSDLGVKLPLGLQASQYAGLPNMSVFTFTNDNNDPVFIIADNVKLASFRSVNERQQYLQSLPLVESRVLFEARKYPEDIKELSTPKPAPKPLRK